MLWREHEGHCGAFRLQLGPPPETGDLATLVQSLLEPPGDLFLNAAELRMADAVPLLEGYTAIGGEPSHGGPDAVYAFEDDTGWYSLHAVPSDVEDPSPHEIVDTEERDGVSFDILFDDRGDGPEIGAQFTADGYRITARAFADRTLLDFALEFRGAWLAAGAGES